MTIDVAARGGCDSRLPTITQLWYKGLVWKAIIKQHADGPYRFARGAFADREVEYKERACDAPGGSGRRDDPKLGVV